MNNAKPLAYFCMKALPHLAKRTLFATAPAKKQEIKNLTDQTTAVLEQFEPDIDIDLDTDPLIPLEEQ